MNNSGIYKIINLETNQLYIGSSKNLDKRKIQHFSLLKRNKHPNPKLQNSYNKYNYTNFEFKTIELCNIDDILDKEQYYINVLTPYFNISCDAKSPMKGKSHSIESKLKLSIANKGKRNSLGYKHSEQVKQLKSKECKSKIPILQYDLEGNFIREFDSIKSTRKLFSKIICVTHISDCCKQRRKRAYGYKWAYKF